jgi:O-antigen/teichoic acid export membrane protein
MARSLSSPTVPGLSPLTNGVAARFAKGVGSNAIGQAIAAVSAVVMVPLFLLAWGPSGYGRWLSLTAILSYVSLLDLGGQSFIGNLLATAHATGDEDLFRQRYAEGVSLFAAISLGAFALLLIGLAWPAASLPGAGEALTLMDRLVLLLLGTNVLVAIPGGVYVTAYRATGRFARGAMVGNLTRLIYVATVAALLGLRVGPPLVATGTLVVGVFATVVVVLDIRRLVPASHGIRLSARAAWNGRTHLSGSVLFWLMAMASTLGTQGLLLVVNAYTTTATVALYATHRTAVGFVGYVGALLQAPLWPELSYLHALGRESDLCRVALVSVRSVELLSGMAALALWILLPFVYPYWTGKELALNPPLLALLLVQSTLMAGWSTCGWALLASNRHRVLTLLALANAATVIVLSIVLIPRFGIVAAAFSMLGADIVFGLGMYPNALARSLGLRRRDAYVAVARPLAALVPMCAALVVTAHCLPGPAGAVVSALVVAALAYPTLRFGLGRRDFTWVATKINDALRRRAEPRVA